MNLLHIVDVLVSVFNTRSGCQGALADAKVGSSLNAYNDIAQLFGDSQPHENSAIRPAECLLVIDSGFSHTTTTPLLFGKPIQQAVRRLEVGGKLLTNDLKHLVSVRHYNMTDETYLMNEIKEAVCFVSSDFKRDLDRTWKGSSAKQKAPREGEEDVVIDYVLPDYNDRKAGNIRAHDPSRSAKLRKLGAVGGVAEISEEYMTLGNERFTAPELLFNPMDIGLRQLGIPEMVMQSMSAVPTGLWPAMLANILVIGGNARMQGFMARLWVTKTSLERWLC